MKKHIFIIDTSAILSGKPINVEAESMFTTPSISKELKPGGRDYRNFQFLLQKGLSMRSPSNKSVDIIKNKAKETGDFDRLSSVDIEILALAFDINEDDKLEAVILSDDYSIQNIASTFGIKYQSISQRGIIKKYKWLYSCLGCEKKFDKAIEVCPICGAQTKLIRFRKK